MRILSKLAALAVVAGTIPAASAQPPQQGRGHSQAAAHTSAVQQALANRQQILSQIAGHGADTGAASRAQGLDRATAGSANASASGRAQGLFRASAGAGNAAAANARGLERASIATGTGRLGNDVLRGLRSDAAARATGPTSFAVNSKRDLNRFVLIGRTLGTQRRSMPQAADATNWFPADSTGGP
jgi:hypothetical protein